jgi:hypothetical protein
MASRNMLVGTGVALAGLGGLAAAAVTVGSPESTTTTKPAAQAVETQTQVVSTVEHRTKRLKARRADDGTTQIQSAGNPVPVAQTTTAAAPAAPATPAPAPVRQSRGSDDGPGHDVGDDHGGRENEVGDDHGGDDAGGADDSGHGGSGPGGDDDHSESNDD